MFHDRLINTEDKSYFYRLLQTVCKETFGEEIISLPDEKIIEKLPTLFFGDFLNFGTPRETRIYEEIKDISKMESILQVSLNITRNLFTKR